MDDLFLWILLAFQTVSLLLLITFLMGFRRLIALIQPVLDKFAGPGGQIKIPNLREVIALAAMKLMEQLDFSKLAGNLFGGGGGKA